MSETETRKQRINSDIALAEKNKAFYEKIKPMGFVQEWAEILKEGTGNLIDIAESWIETKIRAAGRIMATLNTPSKVPVKELRPQAFLMSNMSTQKQAS